MKRFVSAVICFLYLITQLRAYGGGAIEMHATLTPDVLLESWESTYVGLRSMKFSTVTRLLKYTPGTGQYFANMLSPARETVIEKLIDGDHYWACCSYFDRTGAVFEDSFDGTNTMEFQGIPHRGFISRGRSGRSLETDNDVARCLLCDPVPEASDIPKARWGKPVLGDEFRNYVTDGAIRPDAEVRPQLELVDGIACHVMQLKDGSARVWLAQQLGTLPLRFERTIDNETCMRLNVIQFASVLTDTGNFWYPVKATIEQGTTYIGKIVSEVDVKEFVLNPVIPPDAFKIKFPDGTRVYDENLGLVYTTHSAGHDPHSPIVVLHDGAKPEVLSDLPTEATAGVTGNSIAQATAPKLSDTSDGADGNKASDPVAVTKFSHVKSLLIIGALCVFGLIIVSCRQFSRRQAE